MKDQWDLMILLVLIIHVGNIISKNKVVDHMIWNNMHPRTMPCGGDGDIRFWSTIIRYGENGVGVLKLRTCWKNPKGSQQWTMIGDGEAHHPGRLFACYDNGETLIGDVDKQTLTMLWLGGQDKRIFVSGYDDFDDRIARSSSFPSRVTAFIREHVDAVALFKSHLESDPVGDIWLDWGIVSEDEIFTESELDEFFMSVVEMLVERGIPDGVIINVSEWVASHITDFKPSDTIRWVPLPRSVSEIGSKTVLSFGWYPFGTVKLLPGKLAKTAVKSGSSERLPGAISKIMTGLGWEDAGGGEFVMENQMQMDLGL